MTNRKLAVTWAVLYGATMALGFIPQPQGVWYALLVVLSLLFFVPGGILLYRAVTRENLRLLDTIRNLCLCSLGLTLLMLILNFLTFNADQAVVTVMYCLLGFVSAPMYCGQVWLIPLFGWACLLTVCLQQGKELKKKMPARQAAPAHNTTKKKTGKKSKKKR